MIGANGCVTDSQGLTYGGILQSDVKMKRSLDLPPLDALDATLAAKRTGSFSAAAEEIGLTHGAVSRRVSAVERWAGFRVFERHGRGVRISLDGERLIAQIERAFAALDDGRRQQVGVQRPDVVHVSVVPSFARLWLVPHLRLLEGIPQDTRVEVEIDHRFATLSDARIAIRFGSGTWPGVVATPLFDEELVPVASMALLADQKLPLSLADLSCFPLLHDTSDGQWKMWFSGQDMPYERRFEDRIFSDYDMTLLAASQGMGIALLRAPYGADACRELGLCVVSEHREPNRMRYHVVSRPGPRNPATDRLIRRILQAGQVVSTIQSPET
jgi:LysR family transcriptional regulator, glycine cleavage system transcriptional activator